ncbi:hypothetical protein [Hoeflea prorocentri]|uniref:Uncharacterized protein n=1 Tax=Hoeflea prorocentri TaxID=1922333 RepID=A0A9X3UGN7_9HYPH|nr:hypothetical protein [Hoeflea prorocentri]MCY6381018.1 hypothetical protein [Hoeflea prorocentri]MDA5398818.1 hypothetical protein [Hoeflea prorocentri]
MSERKALIVIDMPQLSNLFTMHEKHRIDGYRPLNISSSSPKALKRIVQNWP